MRLIKALLAGVVLAAIVVGPPWALMRYIGNPWPVEGVSLSAPLTDGAVIGLLAVIVWVLWAQVMACILVEALAALTDDRVQLRVPFTLGVQQHLARQLITAVVVATVATPVAAGAAVAAAPNATSTSSAASATSAHENKNERDQAPAAKTETQKHEGRTTTVTVMRLDSLWSIAERHLGDGDQWPKIAALNEGATMNDGTRFVAADHIKPGWELRIPGGPVVDDTESLAHEVTVEKGDTLSEIALEELGDAQAYPRLFEASKTITQPGGAHLSNADLIQPGWTIKIPGQATPAEANNVVPQVVEPPASETPQQEPAEQVAPSQEENPAAEQPAESAGVQDAGTAADQAPDVDEQAGWPVRTIGGVCALLAAALVGLIALRRTRQRRVRKPGQQMPFPAAEGEVVEQEIRSVADELGLDNVDVALRALVASCDQEGIPRPVLRLARLTGEQLDVYFTDPATLPAPWEPTSEPGVWVLTAAAAAELDEPADVAAPWPALVTVGHDDENGILLLNLAVAATFGVVGDDQHVREVFTAIALELGTAPWAKELSMTTVGSLAELGDVLEPGRVRYVPTVSGSSPLLDDLAAAMGDGRVHLVLDAGRVITRKQHDQLRSYGAVVVTNGWFAGDTALNVTGTDQARLLPYELNITPQLVDQRTYDGLLKVLQTSLATPSEETDSGPGERVLPFDSVPDRVEPPGQPVTVDAPRITDEAAVGVGSGFQLLEDLADNDSADADTNEPVETAQAADRLEEPAVEGVTAVAVTESVLSESPAIVPVQEVSDYAEVAQSTESEHVPAEAGDVPSPPSELTDTQLEVEPVADVPAAAVEYETQTTEQPDVTIERDVLHPRLATGHPVIRLLGSVVDIVGAAATAPTSQTHQKVCTRIAAYLALNPSASRPALTQAVWGGQRISPSTVDSRISNLRNWLAGDPETGQKYLPPRSLRFSDAVTTDWDAFTGLVGTKPATASTDALEEALSLVPRDTRPLEGEESKHYGFAEYVVSDIVDIIVDATYELARRRYFEGSWRKAGEAAARGVYLDPGNERLWRIRIHAAHSAGNPAEVAEAIDRMHARITELGFELEDETTELLQALARQDSETISNSRKAL